MFASKELTSAMSAPTEGDMQRVVRLAHYLRGCPRVRVWFCKQGPCTDVMVFSDTDWAGCRRWRRSTTGGYAVRGSHVLKTWCRTQATVALSSAEAELYGLVRASSEALGLASLHQDLGTSMRCTVLVDATAALAIVARQCVGRVRHLDTYFLWMQEKSRLGKIKLETVDGTLNGADLFTKALPWSIIEKHTARMDAEVLHTKGSLGYSLHCLGPNGVGVDLDSLAQFHRELNCGESIKMWHRLGLGVRTTNAFMKNGPPWNSVVGRMVLDANSGEIIRKEPASDITRHAEHTLLPGGPRDTITLLLYTPDTDHNDGDGNRQQRAQPNQEVSSTGIPGNIVFEGNRSDPKDEYLPYA